MYAIAQYDYISDYIHNSFTLCTALILWHDLFFFFLLRMTWSFLHSTDRVLCSLVWALPEAGPNLGGSCSLVARWWGCHHCKDGDPSRHCRSILLPPLFSVIWIMILLIYQSSLLMLVNSIWFFSGWHRKWYSYRLRSRGIPDDVLLLHHRGSLFLQRWEDGWGHHQFHQEAQGPQCWSGRGSDPDGCWCCRRGHPTFVAISASERRALTNLPYATVCRYLLFSNPLICWSVLRLSLRGIS